MHTTFDGLIGLIILIYLDDLTMFCKKREDHFTNFRNVLLHYHKYRMSLNPTKSIFVVQYGKLLGHVVSRSGISIDLDRV